MSAGAGFGRLAVLLSEREFSIPHGVVFVLVLTVMGVWMPTILVFDLEFLVAGLFAGFVLGSPVEGFFAAAIGGGVMALFWLVLLGASGAVGLALATAILAFCNVTAGGVVGGFVGKLAS